MTIVQLHLLEKYHIYACADRGWIIKNLRILRGAAVPAGEKPLLDQYLLHLVSLDMRWEIAALQNKNKS